MATTTSRAVVVGVDERGATVAWNGKNTLVRWGDLKAAAHQEDEDLSRVYKSILKEAEDRAARGPVVVTVETDRQTGVGYRVYVNAVWGGGWGWVRWNRDEGDVYCRYKHACAEARDIARRAGGRALLSV